MKFVPERFLLAERAGNLRDRFSMGLWRNSVAGPHQSPVCCENPLTVCARSRRILIQVWTASLFKFFRQEIFPPSSP